MAFGALLGFAAALLVWARTAQTSGCWAVSGALAGTHHWTQGNSYCVHSGSLVVGNGATLTIDPGVHVYFDSSSLIVVANGGKLFVNGTSTQPVNFTSVLSNGQPVRWVGIVFQAGSQGSLRHCVIEGAGGGGSPALWLESAITVEHCRIHHNTDEGVLLQGAGLTPVLRHVTLTHNGGYPIVESTIDMASVYEGISAANNVTNAVRSAGDFLYRHRTLDSASLGGLRFEVDDILVTAGNALTVTAGTEVRF
ncbi:MAG: right-handed parallel beta-helix repeat-containing protein, partial [Thermoflexales bacterium]|nr:right-handed parallel beta-helix repeat-containing protein [Thermoflexales bacterium]